MSVAWGGATAGATGAMATPKLGMAPPMVSRDMTQLLSQ